MFTALPGHAQSVPRTLQAAHNTVTPVPGDLTTPSGLHGQQAHAWYIGAYRQKKTKNKKP